MSHKNFLLTEPIAAVQQIVGGAYPESNGLVVMEAENGARSNGLNQTWLLKTSLPGYTGTSYLQSSTDLDALYQTDEVAASPRIDYPVNFTTAGTYTVWVRGYAPNAAGDSLYVGLAAETTTVTGFEPRAWRWTNISLTGAPVTAPISTTGLYTVSLWLRDAGAAAGRPAAADDRHDLHPHRLWSGRKRAANGHNDHRPAHRPGDDLQLR